MDLSGPGATVAIAAACGTAVSSIITAVAASVVNLRKQPFEQAMIMVGKLEERIDQIAQAHRNCEDRYAQQQVEVGELRAEVRSLREELERYEQQKAPPDPSGR
jgi:cell division protein FtsB